MVVQVRRDTLRLVRQLDHSLASGRMALEWAGPGTAAPPPFDVALAIALHDLAWSLEDREPVWDRERRAPMSFLTIPDERRTALYAGGLDRVERIDGAAAILGSLHYSRFAGEHEDATFLAGEAARRARIRARLRSDPGDAAWKAASDLLRHLDDLSLFVCLAGPGCEAPPSWLTADRVARAPGGAVHALEWLHDGALALTPFPFRREVALSVPCRDLPRREYRSAEDLRAAWEDATPRSHDVTLRPGPT